MTCDQLRGSHYSVGAENALAWTRSTLALLAGVFLILLRGQCATSSPWPLAGGSPFKNLSFVLEPGDVVAARGSTVLLPCAALYEGRPPTVTSWMRGADLINILNGHQSRRIILENGSLLISGMGQDEQSPDEGLYRCVAEVADDGVNLRIATPQVKLEIESMPRKFAREPQGVTLTTGSTAMFVCKMASRPAPTYAWLKDTGEAGGIFSEVKGSDRILIYPEDGVLEVQSVVVEDFGDYRCRAALNMSNPSTGRTSEPARLSRAALPEATGAPEFIVRPWDVSVRLGANATLYCAVTGGSAVGRRTTVTWLKDGSTIDTEYENNRRFSIVGLSSLRLVNASETDTGVYTCRAENWEDSTDSDAVLTVLVPPRFTKKPSNTYANAGEDVDLECDVYGVPSPRVYWLHDSEELSANGDYVRAVAGRGLRIAGATETDAGAYQCVAESEAGRAHAVAHLVLDAGGAADVTAPPALQPSSVRPGGGPGRPRELQAAVTTTNAVSLVWQAPADDSIEIVAYQVVSKDVESSRRPRTANVSVTSFTMTSLKSNTVYTFRVFAIGRNGRRSLDAAELTTRTPAELAVPSAPVNFSAIAVSSTEVRVAWTIALLPASAQVPPLTAYRVYYYTRDQSKELSINTTALTVVLDRLQVHTDYYVRVAAINSVGEGVPSEEVQVRTFSAAPTAPPQNVTVEATGTSTVVVQWQPPPLHRQNGLLTGYKIKFKMRDRIPGQAAAIGINSDTATTDGDARSHEIARLEADKVYLVRIAATNVNGTGEYSPWLTVATYAVDLDESIVPGKPLYIQTKAFSTELIINWGPPIGNIMIRGYKLGYGTVTPDELWIDLEASDRYYTLRNLQPTRSYVMSLYAHNRAGRGFPIMAQDNTRESSSTAATHSIPDGNGGPVELTPPLQVKAVVLTSTTVLVTWHDNSLGSNQRVLDNRFYAIKYTALTGALRKPKMLNSTELSIIVDGLRPATKYEFSVKLVRGTRESVYSLNQRNTTFEAAPGSAPRDLTVTSPDGTPTELMVSWQPPIKANGQVTNYVLYYATENRPDVKYWVMEDVTGDRLNKRVRPVTPDTTYFFKIEAHNSKGRGPSSPTEVFRTPKADGSGGGGIVVNSGLRLSSTDASAGKVRDGAASLDATAATPSKLGFGSISSDVMWIVIGCVALVTLIAIVALVVLCRRRLVDPARDKSGKVTGSKELEGKGSKAAAAGGARSKDQPPDLFMHHERLPLKQLHQHPTSSALALAAVGEHDAEEAVPMLDPNQPSYDLDHRSVSGGADTYFDSYSSLGRNSRPVLVAASHGGREGMPRAAVPPMSVVSTSLEPPISRPSYPRTQYHQQYGSGARVHVGDSSAAALSASSTNNILTNCQPQLGIGAPDGSSASESRDLAHPLRSFNIPGPPATPCPPPQQLQAIPKHVVRPQPLLSPYKTYSLTSYPTSLDHSSDCGSLKRNRDLPDSDSLKRTPRLALSSSARPCQDSLGSNGNEVPLMKTHSSEQLSEEMANLEGIMKDINTIKMQFEY